MERQKKHWAPRAVVGATCGSPLRADIDHPMSKGASPEVRCRVAIRLLGVMCDREAESFKVGLQWAQMIVSVDDRGESVAD